MPVRRQWAQQLPWPFQWAETAIYLALALALAGYCLQRLNRRRS